MTTETEATTKNSLTLKWGTVKGWSLHTDEARAAMDKWSSYGVSMSAMLQKDTPEQQQALLDLIDLMDEIYLDWDGRYVTREQAKEYVLNYGKDD
jgi:hypothetical protein